MKYPLIDETTQSASPLRDSHQSKILEIKWKKKPWVLDHDIKNQDSHVASLQSSHLPLDSLGNDALTRPSKRFGHSKFNFLPGENPCAKKLPFWSKNWTCLVRFFQGFAKWQAKSSKFNCWSVALQSGTGEISSSKWFLVFLQLSYGSTLKIVMSDYTRSRQTLILIQYKP